MSIQMEKGAKKRVIQYRRKKDGTYDPHSHKAISYENGYQFSFVRPEAFELLDDANWDILTEYLIDKTGSIEHIGVYGGSAETSFRSESYDEAMNYAEMFNQESILDWAAKTAGKDWRYYLIRNITYDETKEVDYDGIIETILRDKKSV